MRGLLGALAFAREAAVAEDDHMPLSTHQSGLAHNHLQPARVGNVADLLHYLRWRRAQVLSQRGDEVVAGRLELACHQEPSC